MSDCKASPDFIAAFKDSQFCENDGSNNSSQPLLQPLKGDIVSARSVSLPTVNNGCNEDSNSVSNIPDSEGFAGKVGIKLKTFFGDWCSPKHWKFQLLLGIIICIEIAVVFILFYPNKSSAEPDDQEYKSDVPTEVLDPSGDIRRTWIPLYRSSSGVKSNSVLVDSPFKLHSISQTTYSVIVSKLVAEGRPTGISKSGRESVRLLQISGEINQAWLYYLLESFPNLVTLRVNVDIIGDSIRNYKQGQSLSPVALQNLEEIEINSAQKYAIFDWGFEITLTSVKTVFVRNANLDLHKFKKFTKLLSQTAKSLDGITIVDSIICSACDVTELQFENLRYLNIARRREIEELSPSQNILKEENIPETKSSEEYETVEQDDYEWKRR